MVAKITKNFRLHNAKQFIEQFSEEENSNIYFFIANSTPWPDDGNPPEPIDSISEISYDIWNSIIAMKKISPADVSLSVPRIDWTSGVVYTQYTSSTEFHNGNFYVITGDYNVYKCIGNNSGAPSTIQPTGQLTVPLTTNDGYVWKFMYNISASDALKFSTNKFMPVKTLTTNDDSPQWKVQQAATNGNIETVTITAAGLNYIENGGVIALGGVNNVKLPLSASSTNDAYNGLSMYILNGAGIGQIRKITDYIGADRTVVLETDFGTALDVDSTFIISPTVTITGDGTGARAYSRVVDGSVTSINVISKGTNYTYANVAIGNDIGNGATAVVSIPPLGGHGSNAVDELFAHNVIMNVKLRGSESNTFMTSNDFRTIGLIADPLKTDNALATATTYNQNTVLTLTSPVLTFTKDEIVRDSTGKEANVVEYIGANRIAITENRANFTSGTTLTGLSSGATASVSSVVLPELKKFSGKVMYVENRAPTTRAVDQEEDLKTVILF